MQGVLGGYGLDNISHVMGICTKVFPWKWLTNYQILIATYFKVFLLYKPNKITCTFCHDISNL